MKGIFDDETIIALTSARGSSERGILRLAGPGAWGAVAPIFLPDNGVRSEKPTRPAIRFGRLVFWGEGRAIPVRLYFWPDGSGYTGSESVELHLPGSPPILEAAVQALCARGTVRLAKPGEFTLRAFLAGRLDLTRAEAVLGVIDAESERSLNAALRQLAGNLSEPLGLLREGLCETLTRLEAGFDFAEEDIDFIAPEELSAEIGEALRTVDAVQRRLEGRTMLGAERRATLIGRPNAGKSSLFNRLRERFGKSEPGAIVSPIAGTTRDWLETELSFGGLTVTLVDTAGIDASGVDASGIDGANDALSEDFSSDGALLLCVEARRFLNGPSALDDWERRLLDDIQSGQTAGLILLTQTDRVETIPADHNTDSGAIWTSALARCDAASGLDRLSERLRALFAGGEAVPSTAARCREALDRAAESLRLAGELADRFGDEALIASEIRVALDALGRVTGAVTTDDILDRIFSRFCIGK